MLKTPIARAAILSGACLLAIAPFFYWGSPSGHDFEFHMFSWMEVLSQWKHAIFYPRWAALAHFGYGEARFLFYPPASWTLGAGLGAILPWQIVPGAYCWIALMLAGSSMYRLTRQWLAPADALFAALFYALNPYHLLIVYWRSAYAELLAGSLLPLLVLCLMRLYDACADEVSPAVAGTGVTPARATLWLGLTLAAAWLTNAPSAIMIYYSAATLTFALAILGTMPLDQAGPHRRRFLFRVGLAMLLGAGLASFYLLPAIYEQRWINLNEVMAPGVRPIDNFLFTKITDPDHNRFNVLVSVVGLLEIVVLGLAISFIHKRRTASASLSEESVHQASRDRLVTLLSLWGVGCAIVTFSFTNFLWQHLPKFRFVQLPFRWLLCVNAALAVLIAVAIKRWPLRAAVYVTFLLTLLIVGYRTQLPWWDETDDIHEMRDAVADGSGYEGVDEYVPAHDDPYELNKQLPRVSDDDGIAVPVEMRAWNTLDKRFTIHSADAQDLTIRLFNYPAWEATVNGRRVAIQSGDVTGLMIIPVEAGTNDVRIVFRRTADRLAGGIVSLLSVAVFLIAWFRPARLRPARLRKRRTRLASTIEDAR